MDALKKINESNVKLFKSFSEEGSYTEEIVIRFDSNRLTVNSDYEYFHEYDLAAIAHQKGFGCLETVDQTGALNKLDRITQTSNASKDCQDIFDSWKEDLTELNLRLLDIKNNISTRNNIYSILRNSLNVSGVSSEYIFAKKDDNIFHNVSWTWKSGIHSLKTLESVLDFTMKYFSPAWTRKRKLDSSDSEIFVRGGEVCTDDDDDDEVDFFGPGGV